MFCSEVYTFSLGLRTSLTSTGSFGFCFFPGVVGGNFFGGLLPFTGPFPFEDFMVALDDSFAGYNTNAIVLAEKNTTRFKLALLVSIPLKGATIQIVQSGLVYITSYVFLVYGVLGRLGGTGYHEN